MSSVVFFLTSKMHNRIEDFTPFLRIDTFKLITSLICVLMSLVMMHLVTIQTPAQHLFFWQAAVLWCQIYLVSLWVPVAGVSWPPLHAARCRPYEELQRKKKDLFFFYFLKFDLILKICICSIYEFKLILLHFVGMFLQTGAQYKLGCDLKGHRKYCWAPTCWCGAVCLLLTTSSLLIQSEKIRPQLQQGRYSGDVALLK